MTLPRVPPAGEVICARCPLRAHKLFKPLSPEELAMVQKHKIGERLVAAGEPIFTEGEVADRLYTLLSGWAIRFKTLDGARRQILNVLLPGDLIGLQARLFEKAEHGIQALTPVRLCVFARGQLWDLYRDMPELAFDLTWLGAHEEAVVDETLLSVGQRPALARAAALLVHLIERCESLGLFENGVLPFPLTQLHLADMLGLSAVHTNRVMQTLRHEGLIVLGGGTLRRWDGAGLRQLARIPSQKDPPGRPLF